ncbi:hypothetical protein [Protofrankia symbiont of Coriaria ruscifolia]|uniref:hypothetical protein n=1 Tax=Protofrankia symbiont of Coriaria ruscifolia TaxID=1306542 RepID=UPI001040E1BF|nr:hypothetical protein [Protofrankia symbiont of Coriaria ruscifolia]
MDDNDRRRLIEFHVTPLIEHAVEELRALIPKGDNIKAIEKFLFLEVGSESLKLNKQQRAAFEFLLTTVAYHRSLIVQAWPNMERRSRKRSYAADLPQYGVHALGMFLEDMERKLRVEIWDLGDKAGIRAVKINA